ncbi:MAG: hypothetical protein JWM31_2071, partial [Solirubrobacterales bacterium]|nr:hypothetical protein [Solirubrobacterales bacterium]
MTEGAGRGRRLRGVAARVFPGPRTVWLGALVVVLFGAVLLGRMLDARTASTTGTNSVDVAAVVAHAKPGQTTCIRDLVIPKRTGRIEVWLGLVEQGRRPRLDAWVPAAGPGAPRLALRSPALASEGSYKTFALDRPLPRTRTDAAVCLRARGEVVDYGGASVMRLPGAAVSTVGHTRLTDVGVGVQFLRAQGDAPRVADALTAALHRATLFAPGVGGVAIYLLLLVLLLGGYGVVRVAATADSHPVRRLALFAAALALVHSCAWILLLQPFHGADESEHFAYVQHVAATNHKPAESQTDPGAPYSSSELRLMEAVHHNSTILNQTSKLRWDRFYEQEYQRSVHPPPSIADGGGYTESASGHSPLYYAVAGLPYRLMGRPATLTSALLVTRLFSALIAALVAALAVYTASYMLPDRRAAAWLAGVLVALQPVFASVSAAVNNDTAVNVLAALLVFLAIRTWRLGATPRSAVLLGVVAVLLPVAKITGFALLPPLGLLLLALAAARGVRPTAR